jgi:hypothetical protein
MSISSILKSLESLRILSINLDNTIVLEELTVIEEQIIEEREQLNKLIPNLNSNINILIRDNKKRFNNEINMKKKEIIEKVNKLIEKNHNPDLIDPEISPNENTIYKIYSDFGITSEKGGWSYGRRNLFNYMTPLFNKSPIGVKTFQCKISNDMSYAIMKLEDCLEIYELMRLYIKLIY